jgi:glycolate oxidase iron-sulfur subunit
MQTQLSDSFKESEEGQEAERILRQCVHCGMCNATCPTYQLLGDELDGPRGRIYLIKQVLEGKTPTQKTQLHLDRCLTCRSCETTCPSGVQYGRLLEIGRHHVEQQVGRSWTQTLVRTALKKGLTNPRLFQIALDSGRKLKPLLPQTLQRRIPAPSSLNLKSESTHARKMILLDGCVQPVLSPNINNAAMRILDRCGVQCMTAASAACCGALSLHMNDRSSALIAVKNNIDAWWPLLEQGAEAIVMTASGCGVMVKDYGELLKHDAAYAEKARMISQITKDIAEILPEFEHILIQQVGGQFTQSIAWHAPCTLQHGQKISGNVEGLLRALGAEIKSCANSHLCCGSAGTYSILQSKLAQQLRDQKVQALEACQSDVIASANMACQMHLQTGTQKPVLHWIEILDKLLPEENATASTLESEPSSTLKR